MKEARKQGQQIVCSYLFEISEQSNPQKYRSGQWLPRPGEFGRKWEMTVNWQIFLR